MAGQINWDEVFERFTENRVLKETYSEIARILGVSEGAVRKQFKKRKAIDPRKVRKSTKSKGTKLKNDSHSYQQNEKLYPKNNTNALKHGLYAEVFWTERGKEIYLELVKNNDFLDPITEVRLLQAKIASGELSKITDILNALEIMSKLYDKAIMFARNDIERQRLACEQERVNIAKEKLELEKTKLGGDENIDVEIEVFHNEAETEA